MYQWYIMLAVLKGNVVKRYKPTCYGMNAITEIVTQFMIFLHPWNNSFYKGKLFFFNRVCQRKTIKQTGNISMVEMSKFWYQISFEENETSINVCISVQSDGNNNNNNKNNNGNYNGKPNFTCKRNCNGFGYSPVCSARGVTYDNDCFCECEWVKFI